MKTKEQYQEAVTASTSISQALSYLGLAPRGGNYQIFKTKCELYNIDTSHFKGQNWSKGKKLPPKRPISDYLENKAPIQSHKLRLRLLKDQIFEPVCSCCGNSTWMDQPIPLELDHIDGNNQNNSLENLRMLCPNCHAQTPTYRRRKN